MAQVYIDVRLLSVKAVEGTLTPTLGVDVQVKAASGGAGMSINVPLDVGGPIRVEPLSLDAFLFWGPGGPDLGWKGFVGAGYAETTQVSTLNLDGQAANYTFLFPLTLPALSAMEEVRAGDKARFRVRLRMSGTVSRDVEGVARRSTFDVDWVYVFRMASNDPALEVERSKWVEEVLPGLGYGRWMLYEVPLLDVGEIPRADTYLERAVKFYAEGEWKSSMQSCRDTVDVLRGLLKETATPAFTDEKGGPSEGKLDNLVSAYGELVKAIQGFQGVASGIFSAGAHAEPLDAVVERADAEFALMVAYACRRYVAMRLMTLKTPVFTRKPGEGPA